MQRFIPSKIPTTDFSCRFWELCANRKKQPILRQKDLVNIPLRGQVVFSIKHLFCGNVKAITCIVDEVLVEEMVRAKSAFDEFEDKHEENEGVKKLLQKSHLLSPTSKTEPNPQNFFLGKVPKSNFISGK